MIAKDSIKGVIYAKPLSPSFTLADFAFTKQNFEEVSKNHALYDATNPNLTAFAAHGGKLILWHGWADPHISPLNTIAYYTALGTTLGANRVDGFARLFLFPGGGHCGGGEGPFEMDLLTPIMAWVESAAAPNVIIASQGGPPRDGEAVKARTRPIYPYPAVSVYKGQGSVDDAANFSSKQGPTVDPKKLEWLGSRFYVAP
jgi:feruloyl esterase